MMKTDRAVTAAAIAHIPDRIEEVARLSADFWRRAASRTGSQHNLAQTHKVHEEFAGFGGRRLLLPNV